MKRYCLFAGMLIAPLTGASQEILFQDDFKGEMRAGWTWIREEPQAWRVTDRGLEVRVLPGNMWGPANNARNVLVRQAPDPQGDPLEVSVRVANRPTAQYEQVDLVWYYDDRHMVKIGQELVNGKLSLVMGREEDDRTRTIAIMPLQGDSVTLRLTVRDNQIEGSFRPATETTFRSAGSCDLPRPGPASPPHVSLQVYQGPKDEERWAHLSEFRIQRLPE